ncbi:cytochrome c oxidase polypeptide IV [Boletus reticuloceps]|uniref:Cytochrome c oxidase subunit 4, mitochondrial n=1 Tax=Boletus reticuloceps TaxID=495285 RepID=A0A8I3A6B3_9AGAM|nr:cytochrome c oxidase polypeptide IV [Boletus reticuloceps]
MLSTALRAARPVALRTARPANSTALRALSTTAARRSGAPPPQLFGQGGKTGEIPTDEQQATGLERFQLMGEMEGHEAFDLQPLDSSRVGTLKDPIKVYSLDTERIVGCTGSPAESHELHWFTVRQDKIRRCTECGSAYKLDYHGLEHHDTHHH